MLARIPSLRLVDGRPPAPPRAEEAPGLRPRARWWVLAALACLPIAAGAFLRATEQERALARLPRAERIALYHRTMDTLHSVCAAEGRHDLRDLCRAQAELALLLPECDAACRAAAREQLRTPTR